LDEATKVLTVGGVSVAVILSLGWLAKAVGIKFKNGANGLASSELINRGLVIASTLSENSVKQTALLEQIVVVQQDNGKKLDEVSRSLSIAMERQHTSLDAIREIKNELKQK
jgi:hypothetical protein